MYTTFSYSCLDYNLFKNMAVVIFYLLSILFHFIIFSSGVYISEDAHNVLRRVLEDFEENPQNSRYDHVIFTDSTDCKFLPKVFVWCPITHFKLNLLCLVHNCKLQAKQWTSVLSKESHWNPRLVYDLDGNIIFVQRSYECISPSGSGLQWPKHNYLSGSKVILDIIPGDFLKQLPIIRRTWTEFHANCATFGIFKLSEVSTKIFN